MTPELRVMRGDTLPPDRPPRRHLISIKDLKRDDVERLLATAANFSRSLEREVKKLPTLRGRTVVNLFYESSTRTSSSFELAAKRLSADTMSIKSSGSSVDKGESLKDTAITLGAYDPGRRRRLRPSHAARADAGGRELRAELARVHGPLGSDARAAPPGPEGDAPGADEPWSRDRPRGGRRRGRVDRDAGPRGPRRPD